MAPQQRLRLLETQVAPEWVDYNGHMNDAEYARVFSLAVEALMDHIGLDAAGRQQYGYTIYTLETHLCYRREAHLEQQLNVDLHLADHDAKRLHVLFEMRDSDNNLLATSEQMLMGIDVESGRPATLPEPVATVVGSLPKASADIADTVGRRIGIRRK